MGTFAETATRCLGLSFSDQKKQTSVFHFRLQQTNEILPFPFFVCSKQTEIAACSKTTLIGESWFHISTPWGFKPRSLVTGSKRVVHWTSETLWEWSEIAGSPQGSPQQLTRWLWSRKGDLQRAWNRDRRAVWSSRRSVSHCWREA